MAFATTLPYKGTVASYYRIREECCFKLPPNVSYEQRAKAEPVVAAVHCLKLGGIRPGSSVAVFGAGPIGLLCCV